MKNHFKEMCRNTVLEVNSLNLSVILFFFNYKSKLNIQAHILTCKKCRYTVIRTKSQTWIFRF